MRHILILFALNSCFLTVKGQLPRDTIFTSNINNNYQLVFIDTPHSNFHNKVIEYFLSEINEYEKSKKDCDDTVSKKSNYNGEWITVNKYKSKFYAYYPSEPFYNTFIKVRDSTLIINDFNEGFVSYRIRNKKSNKNQISFELIDHTGSKQFISITQNTKTLFVFKSSLFNVSELYFVKSKSYIDYPIIVNYCPNNRCPEFTFK